MANDNKIVSVALHNRHETETDRQTTLSTQTDVYRPMYPKITAACHRNNVVHVVKTTVAAAAPRMRITSVSVSPSLMMGLYLHR